MKGVTASQFGQREARPMPDVLGHGELVACLDVERFDNRLDDLVLSRRRQALACPCEVLGSRIAHDHVLHT